MRLSYFAIAAALAAAPAAAAETSPLLLEGLFQDHAMFQRGAPIPVWGRARPGEGVTLRFAGKTVKTVAGRDGRWSADLPATAAGGPYELVAQSASGASQTVADVLVGDVWLCSGQSNMELEVGRALNSWGEVSGANDPQMRILTVSHDTAMVPVESFKTPVKWQAVTPGSIGDFSAACYFMGKDLRASQKVPVGLIDASWGGTAIDAWRSETAIDKAGGQAEELAILRAYRTDPAEANRRWGALWERWWSSRNRGAPWRDPAGPEWKTVPNFQIWESWGDPQLANYNGMVWYRTTVTLTAEQAAKPASVGIGWADDLDQTWVNGVAVGNTSGWGVNRNYAIPAGVLKAGENVVTVAILDTYSGGGVVGPDEQRALTFADGSRVPLNGRWTYKASPEAGWPPRAPWETIAGLSLIYNGMIAPIGRYGLKGAAWYQGESDAGNAKGYSKKLGSLMNDWRSQVGRPDLPFLVVQLAGWGPRSAVPQESGSATIREEQRLAVAADPHAGLAVAIDLGEPNDIHPANKADVGHRLARAARHVAYGEAISPSGPEPVSATRSGGGVTVTFRNAEGGLQTFSSPTPIGFELCGIAEGSCRFAAATLVGDTVTLTAPAAPADRVRYCWGDSPLCNLYDKAGLPAGPFELAVK